MSWVMVAVVGGSSALTLGKDLLIDKPREDRKNAANAEKMRYGNWTGSAPQYDQVKDVDAVGDTVGAGVNGFMMANAVQNAQANKEMQQKQLDWMKAGGSPGNAGVSTQTNAGALSTPSAPSAFAAKNSPYMADPAAADSYKRSRMYGGWLKD